MGFALPVDNTRNRFGSLGLSTDGDLLSPKADL